MPHDVVQPFASSVVVSPCARLENKVASAGIALVLPDVVNDIAGCHSSFLFVHSSFLEDDI